MSELISGEDSLDALFQQYISADVEAREIHKNLMNQSGAFQCADRRQLEAWKKYSAAKRESIRATAPPTT